MELIKLPWHWSVAGVIIGLTVPALLLLGNKKIRHFIFPAAHLRRLPSCQYSFFQIQLEKGNLEPLLRGRHRDWRFYSGQFFSKPQ